MPEELLTNNIQHAREKKKCSAAYLYVLFNELDVAVNSGEGYSNYLNADGFPTGALLAWSESYLLQAYANMYRATDKTKYLDKLNNHIKSVISNRDDRIGQKDYRGKLIPAWGTDKYTKNKEWTHYVVHTGMIAYPILDFVQLVKKTNASKYLNDANVFLKAVEESVNYHNKNWKTNHYVYAESLYKKDHILAVNRQAAMGRCLILLYKTTGKQEYLKKATLLAEFIKDKSIQIDGSGGYVLTDTFSPIENVPTGRIADISHASLIIHFAYLAYKNDIVFEKTDMQKFAKTIKKLAVDNNNRFPLYLDGTGNFNYEIAAGQYAFLAEYDKDIADSIADLFFKKLRIDLTAKYMQEDWWGQLMLGLSRLALYQNIFNEIK